ncbi:hypothetical protein YPPY113_3387, partial [Yersinia pestis PY-113]
MPYIGW